MKAGQGDRVVVIGGGVIGAMCAWNLLKAGCQVTIVDRDKFGAACSHGNCGYVSPSHVFPLCQPGAILKTLKTMFKSNSPFAVKPRFEMNFVKWFWNFSLRCNHRDMMAAGSGRHELLQSSKRLYQQLIADENIDCEWQEKGLLFVFDDEKSFREFGIMDGLIRQNFGVPATPYDGHQLTHLEPAIKPGFGGGWHYEGDCHLRPDKLLAQMRERMVERGVEILEDFPVQQFEIEQGAAKAVLSNGRELEADHFVVATGAMTPFLNQHLGMSIPIEPGKGYSLTMPKPKLMPKIPIIFEDSHVAITPMQSKYRIGSTMEFTGYDTSIPPRRLELLKSAARKYLHDPLCDPIEEEWFGWRPMTWDGKPIIDRSPAMNNVWIAAGHNMLGLSMATGTGRLLKELMLGETPHISPVHFAAARFQ
ncbi:MAG: NAD(P)/FAD-dependent oxidoreductase [Pirellulales bacterium]|jgi:D-amino-acid dehydrogenase